MLILFLSVLENVAKTSSLGIQHWGATGSEQSERSVPITLIQMTLRIIKENWDTNPKGHVPSGTGRSTNRLTARR